MLRMGGCLIVTYFLFWFYTTKVLRMNIKAFGITFAIDNKGILSAIMLPIFVVFIFLLIGDTVVHKFSFGEILLIVAVSVMTSVKSGILEEMLFRGYIGFGVEASVVAIIGNCIVCGFVLFTNRKI